MIIAIITISIRFMASVIRRRRWRVSRADTVDRAPRPNCLSDTTQRCSLNIRFHAGRSKAPSAANRCEKPVRTKRLRTNVSQASYQSDMSQCLSSQMESGLDSCQVAEGPLMINSASRWCGVLNVSDSFLLWDRRGHWRVELIPRDLGLKVSHMMVFFLPATFYPINPHSGEGCDSLIDENLDNIPNAPPLQRAGFALSSFA